MFAKFIRALAIGIAIGAPTLAQAQQFGSYVALLSEADHFNSSGQRLTSAAAIIRQDRANFHRFGIKDPQDEGDAFFADEGNRAALEQMLERGRAEPGVIARIVNGTPLIRVEIYRGASGPLHQGHADRQAANQQSGAHTEQRRAGLHRSVHDRVSLCDVLAKRHGLS
jgi:hypothetical protein